MLIRPATNATILEAAEALRAGRLVAFPTETVYGLGADATNGKAVASIYAAKGRPAFNPLIAHVSDHAAARRLARFNGLADQLAAAFWPGGLTLVVDQRPDNGLSSLVTAGLDSVAVRVPSHPVARKLLAATGRPVAAPSANRSGHVSATTAAHVAEDLTTEHAPALAMIIDDGPCAVGLESTIVDVRAGTLHLLRPGAIDCNAIEQATGLTIIHDDALSAGSDTAPRTSPGQLESHYAPAKPVTLNVTKPADGDALLAFGRPPPEHTGPIYNLSPSSDLLEAAANLFTGMRTLDRTSASAIAVMPIPNEGLGLAINDRLRRAAAPR